MDHYSQVWMPADISFEIVDDSTSDPVVTVIASTPNGTSQLTAEPEVQGTTLVLRGTHIQGAYANAVGGGNLRILAQALMERMDFHGLLVEGAIRTTGANPGHRPRVVRFTRRVRPAPGAGPSNP
jgi:hypothetical protein